MGVPGKPQVDRGGLESEGKKWVIAGISLRAPLKPICTTNPVDDDHKDKASGSNDVNEDESCSTTTPTGQDVRISTLLSCSPAPMKRKSTLECNYGSVKRLLYSTGFGDCLHTPCLKHLTNTTRQIA